MSGDKKEKREAENTQTRELFTDNISTGDLEEEMLGMEEGDNDDEEDSEASKGDG